MRSEAAGGKHAVLCRHSGVTTGQVKVRVRQKVPKTDALLSFVQWKAGRSPQSSTQAAVQKSRVYLLSVLIWKIVFRSVQAPVSGPSPDARYKNVQSYIFEKKKKKKADRCVLLRPVSPPLERAPQCPW